MPSAETAILNSMKKWGIGIVIGLVVALGAGYIFRNEIVELFFAPTTSSVEEGKSDPNQVETVAEYLETPWSIAFNDDTLYVTQRSGSLTRVGSDGKNYPIDGVRETSEGGLLGVAFHPEFRENNRIYLYYTTEENDDLMNVVDEYELDDDRLEFERTVLTKIPAASNHNGGDIAFGPDEKLYVTTGDAAQENLAQNTNSLAGKILRVNDDGSIPKDNPFQNAVWSYGHRNPQGIAWTESGDMWSVEHGPSGAESGFDELNKIEKGANYGWPEIRGDETRDGMITPAAQSGGSETWAPAGLSYANGALYFAGLRGQSLYRAEIRGDSSVSLSRHFTEKYGRLRAVTTHNDLLYISTSNRDGRGSAGNGDDKILKLNSEMFE